MKAFKSLVDFTLALGIGICVVLGALAWGNGVFGADGPNAPVGRAMIVCQDRDAAMAVATGYVDGLHHQDIGDGSGRSKQFVLEQGFFSLNQCRPLNRPLIMASVVFAAEDADGDVLFIFHSINSEGNLLGQYYFITWETAVVGMDESS